jgi:hypothetical protein
MPATRRPRHRDTGIVLGHSTYLHRGQGAILQNTVVLDQTMELLASVSRARGRAAGRDPRA